MTSSTQNLYQLYCDHLQQCGGSVAIPKFTGSLYQEGYGLGSIFGNLARLTAPLLRFLVPQAITGLKDLATTALTSPRAARRNAVKKAVKRVGLNIAQNAIDKLRKNQEGGAKRKRKKQTKSYKRRPTVKKKPLLPSTVQLKRRRRTLVQPDDIFG